MRFGRYKVYYEGKLIDKLWSLNKVFELIANMVNCGADREKFTINYTDVGFGG